MSEATWRQRMRPCIACVLRDTQGRSEQEIRAALLAAWYRSGMGACENWPYHVWRSEIRIQRGIVKPKRASSKGYLDEQHPSLFD